MWLLAVLSVLLCVVGTSVAWRLHNQHASLVGSRTSLGMVWNPLGPSASRSSSPAIPSNKKLVVVTGTSSGLGKQCAKALVQNDDYFVVCAVRDVDKMKQVPIHAPTPPPMSLPSLYKPVW